MLLTWTCHICNKERPDAFISVISKDISAEHNLPPGTMRQNVRYCSDNPICSSKALIYKHTKEVIK